MRRVDIVLALVAALLFALGTVLQQRAGLEKPSDGAGASLLLRMAKRPVWLAGIAADALGFVAQAIALAVGRLAVVQPLLVSTVVFALPLGARLTGQRVRRIDIGAALLVVGALIAFLTIADPSGGRDDAPIGEWLVVGAICGGALRAPGAARPHRVAGAPGGIARDRDRDPLRTLRCLHQGRRRPGRRRALRDLRQLAPLRADRRRLHIDDAQPDGAQHRRPGAGRRDRARLRPDHQRDPRRHPARRVPAHDADPDRRHRDRARRGAWSGWRSSRAPSRRRRARRSPNPAPPPPRIRPR